MRKVLIITVLLLTKLTYSQTVIKGRVLDYYENTPLINIKISNNNQGVLSNHNGDFVLTAVSNSKIHFSFPGLIDLVFNLTENVDTLECKFYMIPIEPYKPCIADGYIKHIFRSEPICSHYHRRMDRIWIKKRKLDRHTPLHWRLDCYNSSIFFMYSGDLKFKYQMIIDYSLIDYRKYHKSNKKDYLHCEIEK